jgi:Rrf2 family protein
MKLSTKCRYGLRAVVDIGRKYGKSTCKRKDIARREGLSSSYLENILLVLRNHKIVETSRGVNGGYALCRQPAEISAYDVVAALEGPLSVVDCVEKKSRCKKADDCVSRTVWCELAEAIRKVLQKISIQDLLDREKSKKDVEYSI